MTIITIMPIKYNIDGYEGTLGPNASGTNFRITDPIYVGYDGDKEGSGRVVLNGDRDRSLFFTLQTPGDTVATNIDGVKISVERY